MSDAERKVKLEKNVKLEGGIKKESGSVPSGGGLQLTRIKHEDDKSLIRIKPDPDQSPLTSHTANGDLLSQKEVLVERQKTRQLESDIAKIRGQLDELAARKIDLIMKQQTLDSQIIGRQQLLGEAIEKMSMKEEELKQLRQQGDDGTATAAPSDPEEVLALEKENNSTVSNHIQSLKSVISSLRILSTADILDVDNNDLRAPKSQATQTGMSVEEWKKLNPGVQDIRPPKDQASK